MKRIRTNCSPNALLLSTPLLTAVYLAAAGQYTHVTAQEAPWPTNGWAVSSPEAQGLDMGALAALHDGIESGRFGYVDRLVVIRNGFLVMNERYENDYREISRGHQGPLGCGSDACSDAGDIHQFNYLHPDHHILMPVCGTGTAFSLMVGWRSQLPGMSNASTRRVGDTAISGGGSIAVTRPSGRDLASEVSIYSSCRSTISSG